MSSADVHTVTGGRLGAADPRQEGPVDLRLVPPALAAWAAAALALVVPGRWAAVGAVLCTCVALGLLVAPRLSARSGRAGDGEGADGDSPTGGAARTLRPGPRATAAAAALLCAAAGAAAAGLHAADVRSGPVPGLARDYARVEAEVTVTSDPRQTRPRVRGDHSTPVSLLLDAEVDRLTAPGGAVSRLRTPVLVMVAPGDAAAQWRRLLPSTRLRLSGRLAPPRHKGERLAAVLGTDADEAPRIIGRPTRLQRTAGELRAGLREATDGLEPDARALLPGLVVGDTSRVPPELHDAFKATDLTHLLAVSGANIGRRGGLRREITRARTRRS